MYSASTRAARSQPAPPQRRGVSIAHDPPPGAERSAGMPEVATPDGVEDDVDALAREAVYLLREVLVLIVDRDGAQVGNGPRPSRGTGAVQLQPGEAPKLQERRADPACRTVNQRALSSPDMSRTMQHLVRRDVIQHQADRLGGVQPGRHRNELTFQQADELRVRAVDRHRGNDLSRYDSRRAVAEPIHHANEIPPRRVGYRGRL